MENLPTVEDSLSRRVGTAGSFNSQPLVSIIIPTYNRAELVTQAVESVLDQTYRKIELIVVDDGSTDKTHELLRKYEGSMTYIYLERSERSKARNEGFKCSKGDYIAFLDSDDLWLSTKIEKQVQILHEKADVGIVYTDVELIHVEGGSHIGNILWDEPVREVLYEDLMTHNVITGSLSSVMMRRECLERVGLFDESMNTCEDLDIYRRLARQYKFHKIDSTLAKVRIHNDNTQRNLHAMVLGWEATIEKVFQDTAPRFEYYKYEAITKIFFHIARLYWQRGCLRGFFVWFCKKSMLDRPDWILKHQFWRDLMRLLRKRI